MTMVREEHYHVSTFITVCMLCLQRLPVVWKVTSMDQAVTSGLWDSVSWFALYVLLLTKCLSCAWMKPLQLLILILKRLCWCVLEATSEVFNVDAWISPLPFNNDIMNFL
jgi:hypothetical protein